MLADARAVDEGREVRADLCVIGAGAAGITLARSFAGRRATVVVLESGGEDIDDTNQDLYRGESVGLPYFPLEAARLRYLGGSTNHWGGLCAPFRQKDFEARDWIPYSGWPISRSDLDAHYPAARELVQLRSDEWEPAAWIERDRFDPLPLGSRVDVRIAQLVPKPRRSFADAYRDELVRASNVTVYLHANATQLVPADGGRSIEVVRVATLSGRRFDVRAAHVVVACGGMENPRLLLASNVGNERDLVGRFFLEHPRFEAARLVPFDDDLRVGFYQPHDVDGTELQGYIALPDETQAREGLVDVQALTEPVYAESFEEAIDSSDVEAARMLARGARRGDLDGLRSNVVAVARDLTTFARSTIPGAPLPVPLPGTSTDEASIPEHFGDIAARLYKELRGGAPLDHIRLRTRLDPAPNPESRITLGRQRDALGMPRIQLDWRLSDVDRRSVARTIDIAGAAFGRAGLGRAQLLFDAEGTTWPDDLTGGWHHMGTTRMSDSPATGVVDRDCRVHGVANLHVAGSSVFPTSGSSTPTLTIVALALRLAEHLKGVLR